MFKLMCIRRESSKCSREEPRSPCPARTQAHYHRELNLISGAQQAACMNFQVAAAGSQKIPRKQATVPLKLAEKQKQRSRVSPVDHVAHHSFWKLPSP